MLIINTENKEISNEVKKNILDYEKKKEVNKCTTQLSRGILIRLNLHQENNNLTTIIGGGNTNNNLDAVKKWILEIDPEPNTVSLELMDAYTNKLIEYLDDYLS